MFQVTSGCGNVLQDILNQFWMYQSNLGCIVCFKILQGTLGYFNLFQDILR